MGIWSLIPFSLSYITISFQNVPECINSSSTSDALREKKNLKNTFIAFFQHPIIFWCNSASQYTMLTWSLQTSVSVYLHYTCLSMNENSWGHEIIFFEHYLTVWKDHCVAIGWTVSSLCFGGSEKTLSQSVILAPIMHTGQCNCHPH